jgi:exosortase family protein XrtF
LKKYFIQYRSFFIFLFKFVGVYILLSLLYGWYLNQFISTKFEVDGFTRLVAYHTKFVLEFFNYKIILAPHLSEPSFNVWVNNQLVVRILEGCNAASVLILFISFVVSFSSKFFKTAVFIFLGIVLIHILNIIRITLLTLGLIYYPEYESILHDIVFPLFIYGVVFGLWVIWVNNFSFYAKKNTLK